VIFLSGGRGGELKCGGSSHSLVGRLISSFCRGQSGDWSGRVAVMAGGLCIVGVVFNWRGG